MYARCKLQVHSDRIMRRATLEEYINGKYNGPPFENERKILWQMTQGLAHLHSEGIVHRDIKPTNILIYVPPSSENGTAINVEPLIKLADFGISKALKTNQEDYTNTSVTNPHGTSGWMAPEMYESKRIDLKVDIIALGCIFAYTLSSGKHPYGDNTYQRVDSIRKRKEMTMVQLDLKPP